MESWKEYFNSNDFWDESASHAEGETDTLSRAVDNAIEDMKQNAVRLMVEAHKDEFGDPGEEELRTIRDMIERHVYMAAEEWMDENFSGSGDWD